MKLDIIVRDGARRIRLTIEDEAPAIETTGESVEGPPSLPPRSCAVLPFRSVKEAA